MLTARDALPEVGRYATRKLCVTIFSVFCTVMLVACYGEQSKIDSLKNDVVAMEQSPQTMSKTEIDEIEQKINEIDAEIENNRSKFTSEQIREFGNLKGRYAALILKKGINDFQESVKDLGNQMEGFIEGITDTTNKN
jgi:hypothetical protein